MTTASRNLLNFSRISVTRKKICSSGPPSCRYPTTGAAQKWHSVWVKVADAVSFSRKIRTMKSPDQIRSDQRSSAQRRHQQGFTLVEVGVVLVIIGLLLAAVLKGQELIASARVNNLISSMNGYKAAINGFQDRYRIVPGDSSKAATIVGNGAINCTYSCDDGLINSWDGPGLVNNHLAAAGFYSGPVPATAWEMNSKIYEGSLLGGGFLTNPGGGPIYVYYAHYYQDLHGQSRASTWATGLYTGWNLSSKLLAEMDRRTDDGNGFTGTMRNATMHTSWGPCLYPFRVGGVFGVWNETDPVTNCGAVELLN